MSAPVFDVATCRVCGCSDFDACTPACWWVQDPEGLGDLCSGCVETVELEVHGFHEPGTRSDAPYLQQLTAELDAIDEVSPAEDHEVVAEWTRGQVPA